VIAAAVDAAQLIPAGLTIGIGSAGAVILAMVGLVFRTQQQQIRQQRFEMDRLTRRISYLEQELDALRRSGWNGVFP